MQRLIGTVSRGVRAPIVRKGDDIVSIVVNSVLAAAQKDHIELRDHDIVGVTEAIVARSQGNYASVEQIAADVSAKFGKDATVGVVFPILSRNRFSICLKGIASGVKKIVLLLSYPSDEVGNHLIDLDMLDQSGVNPYSDVLSEERFRELFGSYKHPFTGVDYVDYYRQLITETGCEVEIIFGNDCRKILDYTKNVLTCDIHTRKRTKRLLKAVGPDKLYGLEDIMTASVNESGYCEDYGLLGSNMATEDTVKLFPRDCKNVVNAIQKQLYEKTGKQIEVLIYGDGAFKDSVGKIWELADPVVSPAYTAGIEGQPSEVKLKYLADNVFSDLSDQALENAVSEYIASKGEIQADDMTALGTTPRRYSDLIGSLCDLTSGSGDKGTPIVWIQGYFDNYSK